MLPFMKNYIIYIWNYTQLFTIFTVISTVFTKIVYPAINWQGIESLLIKSQVFFEEVSKKRFDILGYNF